MAKLSPQIIKLRWPQLGLCLHCLKLKKKGNTRKGNFFGAALHDDPVKLIERAVCLKTRVVEAWCRNYNRRKNDINNWLFPNCPVLVIIQVVALKSFKPSQQFSFMIIVFRNYFRLNFRDESLCGDCSTSRKGKKYQKEKTENGGKIIRNKKQI